MYVLAWFLSFAKRGSITSERLRSWLFKTHVDTILLYIKKFWKATGNFRGFAIIDNLLLSAIFFCFYVVVTEKTILRILRHIKIEFEKNILINLHQSNKQNKYISNIKFEVTIQFKIVFLKLK